MPQSTFPRSAIPSFPNFSAKSPLNPLTNPRPPLLASAIAAHGGLKRFNLAHTITAHVHVSGQFFVMKGYPHHRQTICHVSTKEPKIVYQNLVGSLPHHESALRWIWTPKRTWIEGAGGEVIKERVSPEESFKGHMMSTKWDDLDLIWFSGYALWNYLVTPFCFTWPGFVTRELEDHDEVEGGERWRVLEVTYPDGFPTHAKVQRFYFDEKTNLLRRLDYGVDIVGGAKAVHYCMDHRKVDGIVFPMLRRALPVGRGGKVNFWGGESMVLIDICDIAVRGEEEKARM